MLPRKKTFSRKDLLASKMVCGIRATRSGAGLWSRFEKCVAEVELEAQSRIRQIRPSSHPSLHIGATESPAIRIPCE